MSAICVHHLRLHSNIRCSFFPINDNDDPSGHGGSHWYVELLGVYSDTKRSLLVVNRGIGLGFHYDSLSDRNDQVAKETLGKISALLTQSTSKASL